MVKDRLVGKEGVTEFGLGWGGEGYVGVTEGDVGGVVSY